MVLAVGTGCGSESDDPGAEATDSGSPASETSEPAPSATATSESDLPPCGEIWVGDATLPEPYDGCFDGTSDVAGERLRCSSGQVIVTYADLFWAVPGARISETEGLDADPAFAAAKRTCQA
jgi:hypothetical protein